MEFTVAHYHKTKLTLLALLIASLPFHIHISSVIIVIGAILSLFAARKNETFRSANLERLSLFFIAYFLWEVIGLVYTESKNLAYGFSFIEKHHALILMPLIFLDFSLDLRQRGILLQSFIISCFAACLICIIGNVFVSMKEYDMLIHPWRFSHLRFSEPIGLTPVYLSLFIGMAILILVEKLKEVHKRQRRTRALILFCLLFFILSLIALGARTITVSVMTLSFVGIIYDAFQKKSFVAIALAASIPLIFTAFIFLNPVAKMRFLDMAKTSYENSNYGSYFARWKIWEPGIEAIKENLWLGVGTGDHQQELNRKFIKYNYPEAVDVFNMHNQYLQTSLSHGMIGLIILLAIMTIQLQRAWATKDVLQLSFIGLFILGCLTESLINRNKGIIFFLVFSLIFYKKKNHNQFINKNSNGITETNRQEKNNIP